MDDLSDYRLIQLIQEASQVVCRKTFDSLEEAFAALEAEIRNLLVQEWAMQRGIL